MASGGGGIEENMFYMRDRKRVGDKRAKQWLKVCGNVHRIRLCHSDKNDVLRHHKFEHTREINPYTV